MPLIVLLVLLSVSSPLAAQQIAVVASTGKSVTTWHGQADVHSVSFEQTWRWRGNTEIGLFAAPQVVWQPRSWFGYDYGNGNEKIYAFNAGAVVRHHFARPTRRTSAFVELSAGPMWAEKQVPAATSQLNFVTQPGVGVILNRDSRMPLMVGYRFSHISNGGLTSRNPGLNVSALAVGVIWRSARR